MLGRAAVCAAAAASAIGGCASSGGFVAPKPLHAAPEPAVSPAPEAVPAGELIHVGQQPEGIAASADGLIVAAVRGAHAGIDLVQVTGANAGGGRVSGLVPLPGEARHLELGGPDGPVLFPDESDDRLFVVSIPSGRIAAVYPTGRQPHDASAVGGSLAVGNEFGNTVDLITPGRPTRVLPAPLQPGGVAANGDVFAVVGVRARVIAVYRADGSLLTRAACGVGPTHVAAGPSGYFYVADTLGGTLLVFHLQGSHLRLEASIPVGARPYGIAADARTGWVYVTITGSNRLVGLHLRGARVLAERSWATGRQPNSVAVDGHDGLLAVTATADNEIELIPLPAS